MDMQPITRHHRPAIVGLWQRRMPLCNNVLAQMAQARVYLRMGQKDRAKATVDALHPLAPLDPKLLELRADCALATGDFVEAVALFERALTQSDHSSLWAGKGAALRAQKRFQQAAACFLRANALAPETPEFLGNAAECLLNAGQPQTAFETLTHAKPDAHTYLLRARILRQLGDEKTALNNAFQSIRTAPGGDALRLADQLANTPKDRETLATLCRPAISGASSSVHVLAASIAADHPLLSDRMLAKAHAKAADDATPLDQQAALNHMLFRHYDFIDVRDTAQLHLMQFHKIARTCTPYRRSQDSALFTVLKRLRFNDLPPSKSSVLPIFVTGLPGSGHSYAHQLLQNAAQPVPARPLTLVNAVMTRFMRRLRQTGARDVSRDDLMGLQSELRSGLRQAANGSEIVIDSAMQNFRWSGLISAALPEARIVHVKRDKMQTGWAIFSGAHHGTGLGCQHDLNDLNAFQTHSGRLMRHWENRTNGSIVAVSGDALHRKSGQTAHAMVDICQLKWSGNCASPPQTHQSDWYRYADLLAPLRNTPQKKGNNIPM